VDEAIACYQKAIALDPKNSKAHTCLGLALAAKGQVDEAIACYQQAIEIDPKDAGAHNSLGAILCDAKRDYDGAIACFKKAIALDPNYALAHTNLGHALAHQGRFAESLAAYKRGHELGKIQPGWPYPSAVWVRQAEAKAALEAKLPALLKGEFQPGDNQERLTLAVVCQARKLHRAATGLYAAAFAADPKLADDLQGQYRHKAACCAALAAAGQGEDATPLDGRERARLRRQALDWLRADLALYTRQLESGTPQARTLARQSLQRWQTVSALAGLREATALAKLPAEEQKACTQLWADVAALLKKAQEKPK
jgi:serine/threonine-protein kinase